MARSYKRDKNGRFSGGGGGGGGGGSKSSGGKSVPARASGGRQAQTYRVERSKAAIDEARGTKASARAVASSERMQKRGIAKKREKAGLEAVPTAKGLAVKTSGPLAGVRKAVFKAAAKVARSRRANDPTRTAGSKVPRWATPARKR